MAQLTPEQKIICFAYSLLGDGNGEEWQDNPEYTRGVIELTRDTATHLPMDHEDVLALIREVGPALLRWARV